MKHLLHALWALLEVCLILGLIALLVAHHG